MAYKINISNLISVTALIFVLFPYTMLIPTISYTQPYAIIFSFIAFLINFKWIVKFFPKREFYLLLVFFVLGFFTFIITCFPYNLLQDYKYLLSYFSPLFFASLSFYLCLRKPFLLKKIIFISICLWVLTGLIQLFVPSFATFLVGTYASAGEVVAASGRGTLGFAPEPTHNGFHLIFLATAAYLVGLNYRISVLCLLSVLFLAKSSSAVLVIIFGTILFVFRKQKLLFIFIFLIIYFIYDDLVLFTLGILEKFDFRITFLIKAFLQNPLDFLSIDYSVNQRIGGVIIGFSELFDSFFLPNGMSNINWISETGRITGKYPWSLGISQAGIPSGFFIIFYQTGLFSVFLIMYIIKRLFKFKMPVFGLYLLLCFFLIFLGQYMLSNPGFGFIIGLLLGNNFINKRNLNYK